VREVRMIRDSMGQLIYLPSKGRLRKVKRLEKALEMVKIGGRNDGKMGGGKDKPKSEFQKTLEEEIRRGVRRLHNDRHNKNG